MSTIEELLATSQTDEEVWELDNRYEVNLTYSDDQGPIEVTGKDIGSMSNQISIQGESMSQYFEFIMPRYYDNIDLSDKTLSIHYEMNGAGGEITPINMYRSQDKIKFGWVIPATASQTFGNLSIGIWARGYVNAEEYIWKSRTASYTIEKGLMIGGGIPEPDESWYLGFVRQIDEKVAAATTAALEAKQSVEVIESNVSVVQDSVAITTQKAAESNDNASLASDAASLATSKATEILSNVALVQQSEMNARSSEVNAKTSEEKAVSSVSTIEAIEDNVIQLANTVSENTAIATQKASSASISANAAEQSATTANAVVDTINIKAAEVTTNAHTTNTKALEASTSALLSKSYTQGGTGMRENESVDNAKYYYEQAKQLTQSFNGIVNMGTISFEELPAESIRNNAMYNISNSFVSDERFRDGGGIFYGAGNNVIWTAEEKWDVLASSGVTGVKGSAETSYRSGNIDITPANLGINVVNNTKDEDKNVNHSKTSDSATKATQDSNGNVIADTYAKKSIYGDDRIGVGVKEGTDVASYSCAIGGNVEASAVFSQAFGSGTIADNNFAHAEGKDTRASGQGSHAEGYDSIAEGMCSHVEGCGTRAKGMYSHVGGKYNVEDTENKYTHIVGGGTSDENRKNIHTLDWDGNAEFAGNIIAHDASGNEISLRKIAEEIIELKKIQPITVFTDDRGNVLINMINNTPSTGRLSVFIRGCFNGGNGQIYNLCVDLAVGSCFIYDFTINVKSSLSYTVTDEGYIQVVVPIGSWSTVIIEPSSDTLIASAGVI